LLRLGSELVPLDELETAKRLLAAEYAFANETVADRVSTLGFYEAIDTYRTAYRYPSLVWAVTGADITKVAARYAGEPTWIEMRPGVAER